MVRLFGFDLASRKRFAGLHLFTPFSDGLRHSAAFVVVVVVLTSTSRLVEPNLNISITLHLIVYALVK